MKKRKSVFERRGIKPLTPEQAEEAVKKQNFWRAFEMLCEKCGKHKEFFWYVKNRDPDASRETKKAFIHKMTRLLAFNYDVHRRSNPIIFGTLKPAGAPNSQPLNYPPEWKEET
jgi:hypothetical protein